MARPNIHFTPPKGWMNDPNGLVKIKDDYHVFYQYYPDGTVWGPMHWGHAVSKDLVNWEHKPIALYPDELGYIFSGSCFLDKENVSGLGTVENPPLLAFYTNHNPKTGEQQQSIAYSLNYETFIKYDKNPVIPNCITDEAYKKDFRDPKVFYHKEMDCYFMVLAAGMVIEFFQSKNLLAWQYAGVFNPAEVGFSGICECPDCFYLEDEEEKTATKTGKWILSISMILPEEKIGKCLENREYPNSHVMQYFVGELKKEKELIFQVDETQKLPLILDHGPDAYAMVSFANTKPGLMIAWGEHWDYAKETPIESEDKNSYRGKLSLARQAKLVQTNNGFCLAFEPVLPKNMNQQNGVVMHHIVMESEENKKIFLRPKLDDENGSSQMKESGEMRKLGDNNYLQLRLEDNQIIVDRSHGIDSIFNEHLSEESYQIFRANRYTNGPCNFRIIQDNGYFEIFAEEGMNVFSVMTYE